VYLKIAQSRGINMSFLDDNFLLTTQPARYLFHHYAKEMPIIDFHCHLNPEEIYNNKKFTNITKLWLNEGTYGDHYKWRLMRANGISERFITGNGNDYEKFLAWAETIQKAQGNPLFEWTHLELQRFFGINDLLTTETAPDIWNKVNKLLQTDRFSTRSLIRNANVKVVCTTDDPASDLHYHKLLRIDERINGFKTLPAMRPDNLMNIKSNTFGKYIQNFSEVSGINIHSFNDLILALHQRFEYFSDIGCKLSDHSLGTFVFVKSTKQELDIILEKGIHNESLTSIECYQYITALIEALMKLNNDFGWTMQFHLNAARNLNHPMFNKIGADTGFDSMGSQPDIVIQMQRLYYEMADQNIIPKSIFYSLNPNDWLSLTTMMQSFQGNGIQRLQLGAAWWFNDTKEGITKQLETFAEQSLLSNFVGMLTDSRSFLSYPRHEYFRRVLCDYYGNLIVSGRVPDDLTGIGKIVQDISYNNAYNYFGFFK
jgi:glucuronate isomerase